MKIVYHLPSLTTVNAYRTIYHGYKNAWEDLGHQFFTLTQDTPNQGDFLKKVQPDLILSSLNNYYLRFFDLEAVNYLRKKRGGCVLLIDTQKGTSPLIPTPVNEAG
ncbi:MAG: hypothetical protein LBL38_01110 [Lactobacillales bacterium]|jgi:hypothetical protein|nr:hypothetical protein [Lactobacillales bacterium]